MSDEDEYRELNNEVVVPAYRRFCEELRLPFHFWDKLPASEFDADLARQEFHLHNEAMDLFNHLKPELVIFKDHIVRFHFTDWGGTFSYSKVPVSESLDQAADDEFFLKNLEGRFDTVTTLFVVVVGVLCLHRGRTRP